MKNLAITTTIVSFLLCTAWIHPARALSILEQELFDLINLERVDQGLAPLGFDIRLQAAAEAHSEDMATNDFLGHTSSDGTLFFERIADFGYPGLAGELIASASPTPETILADWLDSPDHAAILLDPQWAGMGVGYATGGTEGHYWTVDLGDATPVVPEPSTGLLLGGALAMLAAGRRRRA